MIAETVQHNAETDDKVDFIAKISQDHPKLSDKLRKAVPEWKKATDDYVGQPGFAAELLDQVDYVSSEEEQEIMASWVAEVHDYLQAHPNETISIIYYHDGSDHFFSQQVLSKLTEADRERVHYGTCYDFGQDIRSTLLPAADKHLVDLDSQVWFFDDSSNSGDQLMDLIRISVEALRDYSYIQNVFPDKGREIADWIEDLMDHAKNEAEAIQQIKDRYGTEFSKMYELLQQVADRKTTIHVRLMRMTEIAEQRIRKRWTDWMVIENPFNSQSIEIGQLDLQIKARIKDMTHLLNKLAVNDHKLQDKMCLGIGEGSDLGWPPTLTIFAHKIQDNLTRFLISGAGECKRATGQDALLRMEDIKPPYEKVEHS